MPFDGFGTFLRLRSWVVDATNSVKIRADFHDDEDNGFADGLSHCITKDGQTAITQNIPFNSRRIISLADPIDPQDGCTKDYADTKMPLDGSVPMTGDITIKNDDPSITLDGKDGFKDSIFGDKGGKHRWEIVLGNAAPETGSNAGSDFNLNHYADDGTALGAAINGYRATGLLLVKGDPTTALGISTKQYADTTAVNASSSKLPLAGGTVTGNLTVNGYLVAAANVLGFGAAGGPAYLQYNGGSTYTLGNAGTIWHSGNFNPASNVNVTSDVQLAIAADKPVALSGPQDTTIEPFLGAVITGWMWTIAGGVAVPSNFRLRWLQVKRGGTWFTVGTVG